MRAVEFLRALVNAMDQFDDGQEPAQPQSIQPAHATSTVVSTNNRSSQSPEEGGTYVPPLQAKIELLKKSVNVDNVYDKGGPNESPTGHGADNEDEISRMRYMAGIMPAVADEAASDEPLE